MSLERYSAVIRDQQRSVDRLVRDSGERRVRRVLEDILRDLTHALERVPADSYNMTILTALRGQVQAAMVRFVAAGGDALGEAAGEAMTQAARESFATLARLESQFTGAAITLPLREIGRLRGLEAGRRPSVLRHYRRSMARYGAAVVLNTESAIATGLATGEGQSAIIDRVQGAIDGKWYQAERIVRTELSGAYNTTHREAIEIEDEAFADEGGVWAQWSEHCDEDGTPRDNRVAVDSIAMHGQVVRSGQLFVMPPTAPVPDAKGETEVPAALVGRTWSAPPNRPNDRSVVAPWRPHWGIPGWQWVGGQRVPVTEDEPTPRRSAPVPELRSVPEPEPAPTPAPVPPPAPAPPAPVEVTVPRYTPDPLFADQAKYDTYKAKAFGFDLDKSREGWAREMRGEEPYAGSSPPETEVSEGMTFSEADFREMRRDWARGLPADQVDAALFYSHMGDQMLNTALRRDELDKDADVKRMARNLDLLIDKHRVDRDMVVSRGLHGEGAIKFADGLKVGDVFQEHGYTSTSGTTPYEGEVLFMIRVPKGSKAAPIPTYYTKEYEMLLARGTKFRVVEKRREMREDPDSGDPVEAWTIELEIINDQAQAQAGAQARPVRVDAGPDRDRAGAGANADPGADRPAKDRAPVARTPDDVDQAKARAVTEEAAALNAVRRHASMPMAKAMHPSVKVGKPTTIGAYTAPIEPEAFEAGLEKVLGKRVTIEEITHAYAPPPGFTAEIKMAYNDAETGMAGLDIEFRDAATGEKVGKMTREFYGDGVVSHSSLYLEKKYQGAKFGETLNGQALLRYQKWGVKQVDLTAADVGRYAWARLGFNIVEPAFVGQAERYIDRHVEPDKREAFKEKVRLLAQEPWKLAKWDEGKTYPVKPSEHIKAGEHPIGKAILLDGDTKMWSGELRIDDDNPGYRNALRLLNVTDKK